MNQLVTKAMDVASLEPISPINDEGGGGGGGGEYEAHMLHTKVFIGILCSVVVLLAVIGNTLVVSVIIRYKQLQNATNYILLSLAIADITVTFLVMIPAMIQDVVLEWIFPDFFCKVYNAFDITCCTASILHLLLVAIDRYIAIFKPLKYRDFVRNRNVFSAVFLVWLVSLCMSFIPIFMGWNLMEVDHSTMIKSSLNMSTTTTTTTTTSMTPTTTKYLCSIEANVTYAIISSSLSFWIPLVVMTLLYIRIYIVAKRQAAAMAQLANMHQNLHNNSHHSQHNNHNHNNHNGNNHHENNSINRPHQNHNSLASNHQTKSGGFRNSSKSTVISRDISLSTNVVSGGGIKPSNSTTVVAVANMNDQQLHELNRILAENGAVGDDSAMAARNSDDVTASVVINAGSVSNGAPATNHNGTTGGDKKSRILRLIKQLKSIEKRRSKDTKAIKTLGIIMGIFIICWLPFFYMYMYCALTKKPFEWKLERFITWIGYVNSFINPIVYALTNKDFRKAYMSTLKLVSEKICPEKVYQMTFEKKPTKSSSGLNFDSSSPGSRSTRFKTPINMLRNSISRHRSFKKTSDNNNSNQQEEQEREVMVNKKEKEVEQKTPIYNNNNNKIESNHQTVDHNNNEIISSNNNIINNDTEVNVNNVKLKSNFSEDVKNFDYIDYDTMFNESGNNTPKSPLRKAMIGNGCPVVGAVINETTTTAITTITKTVPKKTSTKISLTSFLYRNRLSSKTAGNNSDQQSDKDNNEIILCRV